MIEVEQIEVGEYVGVVEEYGAAIGEEVGGLTQPARGVEQLLRFVRDAYVGGKLVLLDVLYYLFGKIVYIDDDVGKSGIDDAFQYMLYQRLAVEFY